MTAVGCKQNIVSSLNKTFFQKSKPLSLYFLHQFNLFNFIFSVRNGFFLAAYDLRPILYKFFQTDQEEMVSFFAKLIVLANSVEVLVGEFLRILTKCLISLLSSFLGRPDLGREAMLSSLPYFLTVLITVDFATPKISKINYYKGSILKKITGYSLIAVTCSP